MKREKTVEVPESVLKNIILYCESLFVYDKLSAYGDFYYKLKPLVKEDEVISDELKALLQQVFDITSKRDVPYIVIGIAVKFDDSHLCINEKDYDTMFDYGDKNDNFIDVTETKWGWRNVDKWLKKTMKACRPYMYKYADARNLLKSGEMILKAVDRDFKVFEFITKA